MGTLAVKASIDEILASREKAINEFKASMDALRQCNSTMRCAGYGQHTISRVLRDSSLYSLLSGSNSASIVHEFTRELDKDIWKHVAEISGLTQIMDTTAREQWEEQVSKNPPECTRETLEATFSQLHAQRSMIFNRGLVKAFKSLSGNYKTNDAFKLGKKIIASNVAGGFRSRSMNELIDAERVLYVLDGKKPPEHQDNIESIILAAVGTRWNPGRGEFDSAYMSGKLFANGNAHIKFKDMGLIDKANKIIAAYYGETLPNDTHRAA